MNKNNTILITGGTGFLGSYLILLLLKNGNKVFAVARKSNADSAFVRTKNAVLFWDENIDLNFFNNLHVIDADISSIKLSSLPDDISKCVVDEVDTIIHCAAVPDIKLSLESSRMINVVGTRNLLDIAVECKRNGRLSKFDHISTAYIVGKKQGIEFNEDMRNVGQEFHNNYEMTKFEAEMLIEEYLSLGLDISIFRPSMVTGEFQTGKTSNFRLFFQPLRFFSRNLFEEFPINPTATFNLINIDTVCKAILLLSDRKGHACYHLTSPFEVTTSFLLDIASRHFNFNKPKFADPASFDFNIWTPVQRALSQPFLPYFNFTTKFISNKTQAILSGDYGFHLPQIDEANLNTMFAFANASGFIRQ